MTYQDAVSDLARLWDLLPLLVGPPWRDLEAPPLLDALEEFFPRVLDCVPVAQAAFEVTASLVQRHRNVLGLIYALHCDGRSLVAPAIPGEPPGPVPASG